MAQFTPTRSRSDLNRDSSDGTHLKTLPASNALGGRNLLSEDVEILGTITFSDNLTIEGKVLGDVISKGDLTIGEHAIVKGNIQARSAVVHGRVEGNIIVQARCEAAATASIIGDISALTFAIQEGATFNGRSRIGKAAVAAAAAPAKV